MQLQIKQAVHGQRLQAGLIKEEKEYVFWVIAIRICCETKGGNG